MKIYKLSFDPNLQSLRVISYDNWSKYGTPLLQKPVRMADQWDPKFYAVRPISFSEFYMPQEHTKKEAKALFDRGVPDYIFSRSSLFSQSAVNALSPLLLPTGEFLPVEVSGTNTVVYAYHCVHLSEAFDTVESDFECSSPGVISTFNRYVFRPEMLKNVHAFRLAADALRTSIYVTDEVVSVVSSHGLTGFKFKLVWSDNEDASTTDQGGSKKDKPAAARIPNKGKVKAIGKVLSSDDCVMIRRSRIDKGRSLDVIDGNADVVGDLIEGLLNDDEISADAILSVCLNRLFMEFQEGGFAQVVYNMLLDEGAIQKGIEALDAINAPKAAKAFSIALRDVQKLDEKVLSRYLNAAAYTRTSGFQLISAFDSSIEKAFSKEDILELHADWLRCRPRLQILDDQEIDGQIALRMNAVPDKEARFAAAKNATKE